MSYMEIDPEKGRCTTVDVSLLHLMMAKGSLSCMQDTWVQFLVVTENCFQFWYLSCTEGIMVSVYALKSEVKPGCTMRKTLNMKVVVGLFGAKHLDIRALVMLVSL